MGLDSGPHNILHCDSGQVVYPFVSVAHPFLNLSSGDDNNAHKIAAMIKQTHIICLEQCPSHKITQVGEQKDLINHECAL